MKLATSYIVDRVGFTILFMLYNLCVKYSALLTSR
jgi:hypothetical protein